MSLTTEERNHLKSLKNSPGWAILEKLEEEYVAEFNRNIMLSPDFDINNEDTKKKIQEASMYIRARKGVFDLVNKNTLDISSPLQ